MAVGERITHSNDNPQINLDALRLASPLIERAYNYARKAHKDQKRDTGESYFDAHILEVAGILVDWYRSGVIDEGVIAAGLLHDSVEDNPNKDKQKLYREIDENFGESVGTLVRGVSKFRSDNGKKESDIEFLRQQAAEGVKDPRIFVIKLADRLHNMKTLQFVSEEKRGPKEKKARETYVYAQLAERLGMWEVKKELEDLAFRYDQPDKFDKIVGEVNSDSRLKAGFIDEKTKLLQEIISQSGIKATIDVRQNSYYTLYEKQGDLTQAGRSNLNTLYDINDLISFRVIVGPDGGDAYQLLGLIINNAELKKYVDMSRYDDFWVDPQVNGYSALQATFNFAEGATEVAVTSKEREEFNNWGIMSLLRRGALDEAKEIYSLKMVFDKDGKARFLNEKATGVDLVYAVSPSRGVNAKSLIVNGEEMDITAQVPNASVFDIIDLDKDRVKPPAEFLEHCSKETASKIQRQLDIHKRDIQIAKGKEFLEVPLSTLGLLTASDWPIVEDYLKKRLGAESLEQVYFSVARSPSVLSLVEQILSEQELRERMPEKLNTIRIKGPNKPGIMVAVAQLLDQSGSDTRTSYLPAVVEPDDPFVWTIVMANTPEDKMEKIKEILQEDERFTEVTIV